MKRKAFFILFFSLTILFLIFYHRSVFGQTGKNAVIKIKKTANFSLDGTGAADNWSKTDWLKISFIPATKNKPKGLVTKAKMLYSGTGLYFLFKCEDKALTATLNKDFTKLWNEDVIEVFLWPDEDEQTIFEYELSPLNHELLLRVTKNNRGRSLWQPFSYESYGDDKRIRHITTVEGGQKKSGASITEWTAEFFLPYKLLHPAHNIPPQSGSKWRINFYRIDYDIEQVLLAWQPINKGFHEYSKFGTAIFE